MNSTLDIMLDLEFFGTEEDMVRDFSEGDAFPIVSSIGIAIQHNGILVHSENLALNFQEQLETGAQFGSKCMLEFWTTQPLLGQELARTMGERRTVMYTLSELSTLIQTARREYEPTEVNVWGNSLIADNSKVIRLYSKYSNDVLPWNYFENADYREMRKVCRLLGFNSYDAENDFIALVVSGSYAEQGFTTVELHNAEFDCLKQLYVLNKMREFLNSVKEKLNA